MMASIRKTAKHVHPYLGDPSTVLSKIEIWICLEKLPFSGELLLFTPHIAAPQATSQGRNAGKLPNKAAFSFIKTET